MSFLSTGNPMLDLVLALLIGYSLAWLFVVRPLRGQLERAESRIYEAESQMRTSQRESVKLRDEGKGLHTKLTAGEDALTTARNQQTKLQSELRIVTDEKNVLAADLAATQQQALKDRALADSQIAELQRQLQTTAKNAVNTNVEQAQAEKKALEAKLTAIQAEGMPLKANLANLASENESLKWRISAIQAENQLLRAQSSSVLSELETLLWRISPMLRRSLDTSAPGDPRLRGNLGMEANRPVLPHLVDHNGDQEIHAMVGE